MGHNDFSYQQRKDSGDADGERLAPSAFCCTLILFLSAYKIAIDEKEK